MTKRYITIPAPIDVLDDEEKPLVTVNFPEFIRGRTNDEYFGKDMNRIESALAIRSAVKGMSAGEVWTIDSDDWDNLTNVIRTPTTAYNPRVVMFLVPFMKAVTEAKTEKPTNEVGP